MIRYIKNVEVISKMNKEDKPHFSKYYIKPLVKSGKLKMTIPDKPTSRNQKYIAK